MDQSLLLSQIHNLTYNEKTHILNILKKNNVEYTKNVNGYFFNLDNINPSIIDKVKKCVDLIEEKRDLISSLDKTRDLQIKYYRDLIDAKFKETSDNKYNMYITKLTIINVSNNINYAFKKKYKKIKSQSDVDPDILMKEYNKSKKYKINSVFFKIAQIIYYSRRKSKCNFNEIEDKYNFNEIDNEIEINNVDEEIDLEENSDKIDFDGNEIDEVDDEVDDKVDVDDEVDDEVDDDEVDDDEVDDKGSIFSLDSEIKTDFVKTEISLFEMDYYKNLLKKDGFKFDDDKEVIMNKEAYI
jgi:hypothetical protein